MKYVVSFFLLVNILFANGFDYAKAYLHGGLENVEKLVENDLSKKEFWIQNLKDQNLQFGYFQNPKFENFIIVNKSIPKIEVYDKNHSQIISANAVIGEASGDKMFEGDLKTPLGVYSFTKRIQHVDPFYGPLAIVTNYPNFYDKMHKKTGSGIWLHGFPLNEPFKNKTEGCVAVENELLLKIDRFINYKKSLLITTDDGNVTTNVDEIATIMSFIYKWRNAWKYDKYETYLSFYDPQFQWYNKMNKEKFAKYKKNIFAIANDKEIDFSDFQIVPYPTSLYKQKVFQVKMHQKYRASNHRSRGIKTLFIKLAQDGPKILLEK